MSELLLVSSLESVEVGSNLTRSRHPWLTLQQYFTIPEEQMNAFAERVGEAVEAFDPITIQGAEFAEYGPNNDVPVRRVRALHEDEKATLQTVELVGKDESGDKVVRNMWRLEA